MWLFLIQTMMLTLSFVCLLQHCFINSLDSGPLYCNHNAVDLLMLEQMRAENAGRKLVLVYQLSKNCTTLFQQILVIIIKCSTVTLNEKGLHPSFEWLKKKKKKEISTFFFLFCLYSYSEDHLHV